VISDLGKMITTSHGTAVTITVNASLGLVPGQSIDFLQLGNGQVTINPGTATVHGTPGLKLRAKHSSASLFCTATDEYVLIGDLSA
jgi:hypothetical protein